MQNFLNFNTNIFVQQICLKCVHLFAKTWTAGRVLLKFGVLSNEIVLRKKLENKKNLRAAVLCANISQIFVLNWIIKNMCCFLFKSLFNWSSHFFTSFSKPAGIPTDSCEKVYYYWDGFQLVPKYQSKVKLISNISVWNGSWGDHSCRFL